jgi:hypothetical protein
MTSYNNHRSWIITHALLEILKHSDMGIDDTITITDTDLLECTNSLKINDFNFSFVKSLKKNLLFEGYKVVYKENKILKVEKIKA